MFQVTHRLWSLTSLDMSELPSLSSKVFPFNPKWDGRPACKRKMMRDLQELRMADCVQINDDAVELVAEYCSNLRVLSLSTCATISDRSLFMLAGVPAYNLVTGTVAQVEEHTGRQYATEPTNMGHQFRKARRIAAGGSLHGSSVRPESVITTGTGAGAGAGAGARAGGLRTPGRTPRTPREAALMGVPAGGGRHNRSASIRSRVSVRSTVSSMRSRVDPIAVEERLEMTQAQVTEAEAAAVNPELVDMVNRASRTTVRSAMVRKLKQPESDDDSDAGASGPQFVMQLADTIMERQAMVEVPNQIVTVPMDLEPSSMGELGLQNLACVACLHMHGA